MRNTTRMGLALAGAVGMFVACSGDDTNSTSHPSTTAGAGGVSGVSGSGGAGGSIAGTGFTAGTGFSAGTGGTGGDVAGTAGVGTGGTAGTAGAGTAGAGGTPPVVVPTVVVLDNVRLAPASDNAGGGDAGGAGGAGGDGAGGAGGAGGSGPAGPLPDFFEPFDASLGTFSIHADGFSPSVGGTAGPVIFDKTTLTFDAAAGKTGGGAKISVPFSVKGQQADFARLFDAPVNLTGYEFTADVKLTDEGDIKGCISAWLYTWGGGYANDASGEPAAGMTLHLVKGEWTKIRLRMDGPYGSHSTTNFPTFKPTAVAHWGVQLNTFGGP